VQRMLSCLQFSYLPDRTFRDDSISCSLPIGVIKLPNKDLEHPFYVPIIKLW
jgi:hypothetical protein